MNGSELGRLRRVRWGVRAVLVLGVAASVTANVLHAQPHPIAQAIAAWPPLALLLTVELISRVPVHRRWLAAVRLGATAAIAGIAAWVSYWHMAGVASRFGESGAAPFLLPLSVDGLVVVASVSLVELAGRIRAGEDSAPAPVVAAATPRPPAASTGVTPLATGGDSEPPAAAQPQVAPAVTPTSPAPAGELRPSHNATPLQVQLRALSLVDSGATVRAAAGDVGVSPRTVQRWRSARDGDGVTADPGDSVPDRVNGTPVPVS